MAGPFKMKGSPMQRNFGIGASPMRDEKTSTWEKVKAVGGTISDTFKAHEPITAMTNISKTYKTNKAYQRRLTDEKKEK